LTPRSCLRMAVSMTTRLEVMLHEIKAGLNRYLGGLGPGARVRSLADVIQFNREHRREEMPYFEQEFSRGRKRKGR